jgi:hypothetical protein
VISRRQDVDTHEKKLVSDLGRNTEPARRVLAVRDHEIGAVRLDKTAQLLSHHLPAGLTDDIADKKDLQGTSNAA